MRDEVPATRVEASADPAILTNIAAPGCGAAIWDRRLDADLADWLDLLPPGRLPRLRACLPVNRAGEAVAEAAAIAGLPDAGLRAAFAEDAAGLARRFSVIIGSRHLHLRLDVIDGDACRRFHIDNVAARLICTYRGPGTEFGIARDGLDPDPVRRMATGAAGVFRGRLWPGAPCGIVHRSPPIAGTGTVRLVLVIDGGSDHDH
jgi:hypothetical protein